jgi:hypothetical protein
MAQDDKTAQAITRYQDTSLAFDNMILQVGRAISKAQEALDRRQIEFQKEVSRALIEGRIGSIDVMPSHGYVIPETKLEIKIGMSIRYPEGGGAPTLSVVPLNATTAGQSDVNVEAASEVKLRFVSVPQAKASPAPPPSRMNRDEVSAALAADPTLGAIITQLLRPTAELVYEEETHLWVAALLEGREPGLVALVDDRTGQVFARVAERTSPGPEELEPVGAPRLDRVEPPAARHGELVTVLGDNFLTLGGQTQLLVDGVPLPVTRLAMRALSFRMPPSATAGDLEIETANGTTGAQGQGAVTPIPSFYGFTPERGSFDAIRRRGSTFTIQGHNLRYGCQVRFANGVMSQSEKVVSPGELTVEVPEGAGSGPLTLCLGPHEQTLSRPFFVLPRVEKVSPRQARVGEAVTVLGGGLDQVTEVAMGPTIIARRDFLLQTPGQLRFAVPTGALDGPLRVRQVFGGDYVNEITTRDIFYVVPKIVQLSQTVSWPGALLSIRAEGLDADPQMMTLLFDAVGGISEAPVLAVTADRKAIQTRVPLDAATGYLQLIRKRVYSGLSHAETTGESLNKITLVTGMSRAADLVMEERFDGALAGWLPEAGAWRVERGRLASVGAARLRLVQPQAVTAFPLQTLAVYADVLSAESFGLALGLPGGERLDLRVRLTGTKPALAWQRVDAQGGASSVAEKPLTLLAGENYLLQLSLTETELVLSLNQEEVHRLASGPLTVTSVALLAEGDNQRWDNVVVMKGDYLVLPGASYYRFGQVAADASLPELRLDDFAPRQGAEGSVVELLGAGLDEAARIFFNGVEAEIVERHGDRARVRVPAGAMTGPIELRGLLDQVASTGTSWFMLPPRILHVTPTAALAGEEVMVTGTNLLSPREPIQVRVLGQPAEVLVASPSMISFRVPAVAGRGPVEIGVAGFTAVSPQSLEVRRETVVWNLLEQAALAEWSTSARRVAFGAPPAYGGAAAQLRRGELLEDSFSYPTVIFVRPPNPGERALRGAFPAIDVPPGRIELRLGFGMLASARPMPEEMAEVDGVMFEVAFELEQGGETIPLLPRTASVHDGMLDRLSLDAGIVAGRRGRVILSVFAGRNGLRDDAAIVDGRLVALDSGS